MNDRPRTHDDRIVDCLEMFERVITAREQTRYTLASYEGQFEKVWAPAIAQLKETLAENEVEVEEAKAAIRLLLSAPNR